MTYRTRTPYQVLLLIAAVLGAYYPVLNAGFNSIDDSHIVETYGINCTVALKDILMPGHRFYYRPIVELSYYLDGRIWEMAPSFMHLENVLIHLANTLLVFLLGRRVFRPGDTVLPGLPLLAALLFGLHPVNVESVSWVAGRTDPLATLFVLSASLCLIEALQRKRRGFLCLSVSLALVGALAKEVALCFLPLAVLLIFCWPAPEREGEPLDVRRAVRLSLPFLAAALMIAALFCSQLLLNPSSNVMLKLTRGLRGGVWQSLLLALQAFGFYVKKLLAPLPLNFAIVSIDGFSALVGGGAAAALLLLARKRHLARFFIAAAFFMIAPALAAAAFKIAWTPVAERYLYLPSAFFAIGAAGMLDHAAAALKRPRRVALALTLLIGAATLCTVQRNLVWRDNVALYQDAVRQSPGFSMLRNELASALMDKGRTAEADRELEIGRRLNRDPLVGALLSYNQLLERIKGKNPDERRAIVRLAVADKGRAATKLLLLLRDVDEQRLGATGDAAERGTLTRDIIDTNEHLYAKEKDPVALYYSGQLALRIGDTKAAAGYFRRAYQAAPAEAHYKEAARKMAQKLSNI